MAVPDKPELETRTFRPSAGASLNPTGFQDQSTKTDQLLQGLASFGGALQRSGDFEEKRRVFNDRIVAQTAIQLGERNPTFLTNDGQLAFNNLLAEKAADGAMLKVSKHAHVLQNRIFNDNNLAFDQKAGTFATGIQTLIQANAESLQFTEAQQNTYGLKMEEFQNKMLSEFQSANLDNIENQRLDVQSSWLTNSMLVKGGFTTTPNYKQESSSQVNGPPINVFKASDIQRIEDRAFNRGIDKQWILEQDKKLADTGVNKEDRIKMLVNSLTILGRETRNPRIFEVLNQDFGNGFNPATGLLADDIRTASTGLSDELRTEQIFQWKLEKQNRIKLDDAQAMEAHAAIDQAVETNKLPVDEASIRSFLKPLNLRPKAYVAAITSLRSILKSSLTPMGVDALDAYNKLYNHGYKTASEAIMDTPNGEIGKQFIKDVYGMFTGMEKESVIRSKKEVSSFVNMILTEATNFTTPVLLGTSREGPIRSNNILNLESMAKKMILEGATADQISLAKLLAKKNHIGPIHRFALQRYQKSLMSRVTEIYKNNEDDEIASAKVSTLLAIEAEATGFNPKGFAKITPEDAKILAGDQKTETTTETTDEAPQEPTGVPGKDAKPKPPKIPSTSTEAPSPIKQATDNPESPLQQVKNQEAAIMIEESAISQMISITGQEREDFLVKIGALKKTDEIISQPQELAIPFVTPINDIFKALPSGSEIVEAVSGRSSIVDSAVKSVKGAVKAVGEAIPVDEGIPGVIKRLLKGEKPPTIPDQKTAEQFKKEFNLDVSDQEASRLMKHGMIKQREQIGVGEAVSMLVANTKSDLEAIQTNVIDPVSEDVSTIADAVTLVGKQLGKQAQTAVKETIRSVRDPILKAVKDAPSLQEIGDKLDRDIQEHIINSVGEDITKIKGGIKELGKQAQTALRQSIRDVRDPVKKTLTDIGNKVKMDIQENVIGAVSKDIDQIKIGIKELGKMAVRKANSVLELITGDAEGATSDITLSKSPLLNAALFGANFYNASPTESERQTWARNADKGIRKFRDGDLTKKEQFNVTQLTVTLSKAKEAFKNDLKVIGITFEKFKEVMIGVYAAETSMGVGGKVSGTGVVGELQVTRGTFRDVSKPRGNFGPMMAKATGFTIEEVRKFSDKKLKDLLLNNNKFNYLAGAAVMLSKMQNAKKQINGN